MAHAILSMAYRGETPWHGLGNKVSDIPTVDEMLVAAGLDWEVIKRPIFAEVEGEKIQVPGKQALMRGTDNKIFSVVGDGWQPFQNKDAMEFFREYTESGGATLETAGALHDGKVIWGLANINKGFKLNGRDEVKGYILLTSPHEIGNSITVRTTTIRVVCANTMAMAVSENRNPEYRQSHSKTFNLEAAKITIQLAQEQVALHEMEAKALQSLKMSTFDTVRFLASHFQPLVKRERDEEQFEQTLDNTAKMLIDNPSLQNKTFGNILQSTARAPGATPGNAWGVLNGVTHWADHVAGKNQDNRLYNSWMGSTGKIKLDVKKELLEMADYNSGM